ncbi:MAG: M48 family metallopeptidase [Planctomycetota bacterium]|jgi:predicted metal-dependent hydrolase
MNELSISYRRSNRARRLRITVTPDASVTVTVPPRLSLTRAKEFVRSRQEWIQKHLARMRQWQHRVEQLPDLSQEELIAAQNDLFARLETFSQKHDLPYARAAFRCQKTRWGSCSSAGNISLNINIAFLPTHLQDYILLHELCHIRHKNHSKTFWGLLDQLCGQNAKQLAKELRRYPMKIRR